MSQMKLAIACAILAIAPALARADIMSEEDLWNSVVHGPDTDPVIEAEVRSGEERSEDPENLCSTLTAAFAFSSQLGGQHFDSSQKPFEQDDLSYWTDMAQIGIKTYVPYFEANMNSDGQSSDHPGEQTTSYIAWDAIKTKLEELPVKQESGEAIRGNELGLLRLNQAFYPECEGEEYCGIALGATQADHKKVRSGGAKSDATKRCENCAFSDRCFLGSLLRAPLLCEYSHHRFNVTVAFLVAVAFSSQVRPMLDHVFGSEGSTDGTIGLTGNKWSRDTMRSSALAFLASKNTLDVKNDAGVWTTMVLHKMALNIDLTVSEAQAFVDFQAKAVILTPLPTFVPEWFGGTLKLEETLKQKAQYLKKYEQHISANIASGMYTTSAGELLLAADDASGIKKTAWGFLDALIFAGGLSVPGVISSGLAAYYTGLTGFDFDINDPSQMPLLVFESIRHSPPVLGVPYMVGNHRHAPLAGMGGYDKTKYGEDSNDFR